jgi:hypothetical protein
VFDGRIYLYPSHDQDTVFPSDNNGSQYQMTDYHVFSMGTEDTAVTDHGVVLALEDIPWADRQLWAPDAAYKDGVYHLFFPAKDPDGIFRIGVATGTSPAGPFTAESRPIEGSFSIDPAAFTDEDGRTYLFFGGIWGGQLQCWANGRYEENAKIPSGSAPALGPVAAELSDDLRSFKTAPVEVRILDEQGSPLKASDEDRRFFEGSWVHKYKAVLPVLLDRNHALHCICHQRAPAGSVHLPGTDLEPVSGWTTQHSIVEYLGKWYLFYHDCELSGGVDSQRNVKYTELFHNVDGTIRRWSAERRRPYRNGSPLGGLNPQKVDLETVKRNRTVPVREQGRQHHRTPHASRDMRQRADMLDVENWGSTWPLLVVRTEPTADDLIPDRQPDINPIPQILLAVVPSREVVVVAVEHPRPVVLQRESDAVDRIVDHGDPAAGAVPDRHVRRDPEIPVYRVVRHDPVRVMQRGPAACTSRPSATGFIRSFILPE